MTTTEVASMQTEPSGRTWMTVRQVAEYSGFHYQTVVQACSDYTAGNRTPKALKNFQRAAGCTRRVLRADVDRWMRGEPPARATRVP